MSLRMLFPMAEQLYSREKEESGVVQALPGDTLFQQI